jgi:hypothetical protein
MTLPKKRKYRRGIRARADREGIASAPEPSAAIERILAEERERIERILAEERERPLRCSFCGKSQNEVKKLIAGRGTYICNECIDICNEIIADDQQHGL